MANFTEEIESNDERRQLVALRDYVAHELEGNRCSTCMMSKLRTGDTAALVLRLQKLIEDLKALSPANEEGKVNDLDAIRKRRAAHRASATPNHLTPDVGSRNSAERPSRRPAT